MVLRHFPYQHSPRQHGPSTSRWRALLPILLLIPAAVAGQPCSDPVDPVVVSLTMPNQLALTVLTPSRILATWNDRSDDETSFELIGKTADGCRKIAIVGADVERAVSQPLTPGRRYEFRVRARRGAQVSPWSPKRVLTLPRTLPRPQRFVATPLSSTELRLQWIDTSENEESFRMDLRVVPEAWQDGVVLSANVEQVVFTGLQQEATYMFRLRAERPGALSEWRQTVATMPGNARPAVHPERWPAVTSAVGRDGAVEKRLDEIMATMSVEDKVGQVIQAEIGEITPEDVREYRVGSVLNGGGSFPNGNKYATADDWVALADAFYEASMDTSGGGVAIPILWGVDAVHGHNNVLGATLFPHNIGLGAANNPELTRRIGEVTAREVRVTGLDWTFGPTVAVPRDDRWGRTYEGYSEDPDLVRVLAGMMVKGLQGEAGRDFLGADHILSTAKHFLGDGGTQMGVDQGDNPATEEGLRDIHGAGYVAALEAGVQVVMASFSSWHGEKMHGNKELLTDVLKGRMGFDGFVIGDWNGHGQVPGCTNQSCAAAFNAGVDMFMVPGDWRELYTNTLEQVLDGTIPAERLDDAVRRILRVKVRAGLFERGKPSTRPRAGQENLLGSPAHRAVARQAVRQSLVLLKNNGGVLPIHPNSYVLVAGDGADDIGKQCGGWTLTWQGTGNRNSDFPGATSIWDGIAASVRAAGGLAVLSPDGSYEGPPPDVAVVVFGEDPYAEGYGDRDDLEYTGNEIELLRSLAADGIPVVSVFLSGRPLWVNPEINASDAFVAAWLPGTVGAGVADVLIAKNDGSVRFDFQGKLSFSWPKSTAQWVLNRYDAGYDPLFAYGYGLTYADAVDVPELDETRALTFTW